MSLWDKPNILLSAKFKLRQYRAVTTQLLGQLTIKQNWQLNASENMEHQELSFKIGENEKWYNYIGNNLASLVFY